MMKTVHCVGHKGSSMTGGLTDAQICNIRDVLKNFQGVEKGLLFGSRARGTHVPASDVDLALIGDALSLEDQIRINARLNENRDLLKFDVVRMCAVTSEKLMAEIRDYGVEIYSRGASAENPENPASG